MLKNYVTHLSVSSLKKFDTCPFAWYKHYIMQEKESENDAMKFGKLVHLMIEEKIAGLTSEKEEEKKTILKELTEKEKEAEKLAQPALAKIEELNPVKIEVERYFNLKLPDVSVPLIGYIDAVLYHEDDRITILDWKTGNTVSALQYPQLAVYAYALSDAELIPASYIEAEYVYLNLNRKVKEDFTATQGIEWVLKTAEELEEKVVLHDNLLNTFIRRPGKFCGYCGYRIECLQKNLFGYIMPSKVENSEQAEDLGKYILALEEKLNLAQKLLEQYCRETGEYIEVFGYNFGFFSGAIKRNWDKESIFKMLLEKQIPVEEITDALNIDLKGINKLAKKYGFTDQLPLLVTEEQGKPTFKWKKIS